MCSRFAAPSGRTVWWVRWVVAALLLQAAVPLFAAAAARLQGKPLVEVCTVYGVRTVALDAAVADHHGGPAAPHAPQADAHDNGHCALSGVLALPLVPGDAQPLLVAVAVGKAAARRAVPREADASARWIAQRKQGPPARG